MADSESINIGKGFRVRRRGNTYHADFHVGGTRHRRGLSTSSLDEAIAKACEMRNGFTGSPSSIVAKLMENEAYGPWRYSHAWAKKVFYDAQSRATLKSREFTITLDDLRFLAEQSKGACALTGLPFIVARDPRYDRANPFTPSLDRIQARAGYVPGNVRLVCLCVNIALSNWGDGVFSLMAKGYVRTLMDHPAVSPERVDP